MVGLSHGYTLTRIVHTGHAELRMLNLVLIAFPTGV